MWNRDTELKLFVIAFGKRVFIVVNVDIASMSNVIRRFSWFPCCRDEKLPRHTKNMLTVNNGGEGGRKRARATRNASSHTARSTQLVVKVVLRIGMCIPLR